MPSSEAWSCVRGSSAGWKTTWTTGGSTCDASRLVPIPPCDAVSMATQVSRATPPPLLVELRCIFQEALFPTLSPSGSTAHWIWILVFQRFIFPRVTFERNLSLLGEIFIKEKSRPHPVLKTKSDLFSFFLSVPIAPPTGSSGDAACSSKNASALNVGYLFEIKKKQKWKLHLCYFCFDRCRTTLRTKICWGSSLR